MYFDIDNTFPDEGGEEIISKAEQKIRKKINTLYETKPDLPLSPNFAHRVDIELETGIKNTRFLIEIDGLYHNAGYDQNSFLRFNGPTLLQSELLQERQKKNADQVILLRITEPAVNKLLDMRDEQFQTTFNTLLKENIISNQIAVHFHKGQYITKDITEQYRHEYSPIPQATYAQDQHHL